jgi:hypothetical protein
MEPNKPDWTALGLAVKKISGKSLVPSGQNKAIIKDEAQDMLLAKLTYSPELDRMFLSLRSSLLPNTAAMVSAAIMQNYSVSLAEYFEITDSGFYLTGMEAAEYTLSRREPSLALSEKEERFLESQKDSPN